MDNTNCGENCCFVKSGFCKTDKECPFFIETWWKLDGKDIPKLVSDCFPKKFMFEQNNLLHRLLSVQSAEEQLRNRVAKLEMMFQQFMIQNEKILASLEENLRYKKNKDSLDDRHQDFKILLE